MTAPTEHEYMDVGTLTEDAVPEPKPVKGTHATVQATEQEEED